MAEIDKLQLSRDLLKASIPYYRGATARDNSQFEAQQYYNNAKLRMLAGQREASGFRQEGLKAASDATVAMVAQGGTVNSDMLARIKKDSEVDAIAAMFDAKADALTSEYQAKSAELKGKQEYRAGVISMGSSLLSSSTFNRLGKTNPPPINGPAQDAVRRRGW